jgi:hypothetical protein
MVKMGLIIIGVIAVVVLLNIGITSKPALRKMTLEEEKEYEIK